MKILKRSILFLILCACMAFGAACVMIPIQPQSSSSSASGVSSSSIESIESSSSSESSEDLTESSESSESATSSDVFAVKAISLEGQKTEFVYGEEFTVGDLTVTAAYTDGTTKTVTDYSVNSDAYNKKATGKYAIVVAYTEEGVVVEKSYTVTVRKSTEVVGLDVKGAQTEFAYGEEFSFTGAVQKKFADGSTMNVSDYTLDSSAYNKGEAGKYTIKITYGSFETEYVAKVLPSTVIKGCSITQPTTEFTIGDSFTFDGAVNVEYTDGRVEENTDNYSLDSSDYNAYKVGTYKVKLTVGEEEYAYEVTVNKATKLKVLMIGNSYADDTRFYVPYMAEALGFEEVIIGSLYYGGCSIAQHYNAIGTKFYDFRFWENGKWNDFVGGEGTKQTLEYGIKYQDWDYITLQQSSASSGKENTYNSDLNNLVDYVLRMATNKDVKLVWNMTWAYREGYSGLSGNGYSGQMGMYDSIVSAVQNKIETNPAFSTVLPAGTAIQNARTSYLGDTFNHIDGTHLEFQVGRGRYIAALTLFCKLTGYTPDEVPFAPYKLTKGEVLVAKESVKNALRFSYLVTNSQYLEEV